MLRRTQILVLEVLLLVAVLGPAAALPYDLPARWSYAAKFLCGTKPTTTRSGETVVDYATVINIHNPYSVAVSLSKKVALAAPERFPNTRPIPPTKRFDEALGSDHAMSVDCTEIVSLLVANGTPPTASFIEGFVVIDSFVPNDSLEEGCFGSAKATLDVVVVSTTASRSTGAVNHEVTPVEGRRLRAGTWSF